MTAQGNALGSENVMTRALKGPNLVFSPGGTARHFSFRQGAGPDYGGAWVWGLTYSQAVGLRWYLASPSGGMSRKRPFDPRVCPDQASPA